jgi:hypothetical protein
MKAGGQAMTNHLPVAILGFTLAAAGCASHRAAAPPARTAPAPAARADADYPVIVRLVGRHYTVTACSGPDGVVYDAEAADGKLVVARATLDELRLDHPEIYQQVLPAVATQGDGANTRKRDTAQDASIDGPIPLGHVSHPASGMGARGEMLLMSADR